MMISSKQDFAVVTFNERKKSYTPVKIVGYYLCTRVSDFLEGYLYKQIISTNKIFLCVIFMLFLQKK
jgi:hypothetical protein